MSRYFVLLAVALSWVVGEDVGSKVERLAELAKRDLPEQLISLSKRDGNDHFCCKKKPIEIVQVSRAVARQKVVKDKVKVGEEECGLWGSKKCTIYDYEYKQVTYYESEYTHVSKKGQCPPQNITCCHNYFYIKGLNRCVALKDLNEVIKAIEKAEEIKNANE